MSNTIPQSSQLRIESNIKELGLLLDSDLNSVLANINSELQSPLKMARSFPVADSKLNFSASIMSTGDGAKKAMSPVSSQIYNLSASTIDFQTQATTGATFVIAWPATNTLNYFRRIGFTLLGNGNIQALVSAESSTIGGLVNAGTLFVKSGMPIGFIDLKCTDTAGKWKTATSVLNIIENADIYRFGSGAGGGGGTGNASDFTNALAIRLNESFYQFCTPVYFADSAQAQVNSSTASYNLVNSTYDFSAAAQNLITKNLFNTSFNSIVDDSKQLELHAEWYSSSTRDDSATYELSIDGGVTYQAVSMARVLSTQKFIGKILLDEPANVSLYSQVTNNVNKEINATTVTKIAQKFTVTNKAALRNLQLSVVKNGSPVGSYIIKTCKDNAGVPGDVVYSNISLCSNLSAGANAINLSSFKYIATAADYWIVIETDSTYASGFVTATASISIGCNSATNGYVYNGSAWASTLTYGIMYALLGYAYDLRARVTSSASGKSLIGLGVFFDEQMGASSGETLDQQSFVFSGDINQTTFTLNKFMPDSRKLRIYDVINGQVYVYPAFNIDGRNVTFPSGTFLIPGSQLNLLFDQTNSGGYDNSDYNAALMTANHLGSSDSSIDRSSNGRGILLRDASGALKEIWIDAYGNLQITNPKG